ncbi:RIP metalloprotease RseP [Pedobacter sp. JY14-1]|uniref:RIP metalloprotease RseP n=1 Tax=Pedobacter sp. JY14-1 TaxID=3034151 RepID=UPI0023E17BAB|nr:RIP metalloprotease RseP [Pedobacter sp. JY14-1]
MSGLIMAAQLLLGLSILVILHELGHFLAARAFGIKVEKFYLFFDAWGVKLFSFKRGDCEYGIGWLPLGGYVKISGMIDESMDTEQMAQPAKPWEFRSKPAWQRLIVMLGGVIVNIVVGIFIYWMLTFSYGETYIPNSSVRGINPGVIGKEIGLQKGDKVVAVNGKKVIQFDELMSSQVLLGNTTLTIMRDGKAKDIKVPDNILNKVSDLGIEEFVSKVPLISTRLDSIIPGRAAAKAGVKKGDVVVAIAGVPVKYDADVRDELLKNKGRTIDFSVKRGTEVVGLNIPVDTAGTIGVGFNYRNELKEETIRYGFIESLPVGASQAWKIFSDNGKGIWKVLTGKIKPNKAFSGPVEIARKVYGGEWIWARFWASTGFISIALAFMNLLPIPALDGGHVVFLIVEMIKGKPLGDKFMERAQIVGFVLLLSLMVFVLGNDIFKAVMH